MADKTLHVPLPAATAQQRGRSLERELPKSRTSSAQSDPEPAADSAVTGKPSTRRLIICCDGTWKNSDSGRVDVPSNVTRISHAVNAITSEGIDQIVYYQSGVGTGLGKFAQAIGGATGMGLTENIRESYAFLANNYHPGDEIFLIGFSRGAFTARSIGGLVCKLGILTKKGMDDFYSVFSRYVNVDPAKPKLDNAFVTELVSQGKAWGHVKVKAIGVWDTVGSLGVPQIPLLKWLPISKYNAKYAFHDTNVHPRIENAFHALALDERRSSFSPALWYFKEGEKQHTNLKQCWFPGVHSNVGGGYDDQELSDITLAWMMQQLSPFIEFDDQYAKGLYTKTSEKALTAKIGVASGWALGTIYDSVSGAFKLGGTTVRTPGNYFPTVLTGECIHASVRVRLGLMGPGTPATKPWQCPALKGWRLVGIDVDGDGVADIASIQSADGTGTPIRWEFTDPKPSKKKGEKHQLASAATGVLLDIEKRLQEDVLGDKEMQVAGREYFEKILKIKPQGSAGDAGMGAEDI